MKSDAWKPLREISFGLNIYWSKGKEEKRERKRERREQGFNQGWGVHSTGTDTDDEEERYTAPSRFKIHLGDGGALLSEERRALRVRWNGSRGSIWLRDERRDEIDERVEQRGRQRGRERTAEETGRKGRCIVYSNEGVNKWWVERRIDLSLAEPV